MKLRLTEKKQEVPNVCSFIWQPSKKVTWQPGQYLHYELPQPTADDRGIERFFTISSAPFERHIMLTTRFDTQRSSTFKKALFALNEGDQVKAGEPRGEFLVDPDASRHIFIAGGIGVTPYRSMLLQLEHEGQPLNVDLLYANRDENFVFGDLFAELEKKYPEFKVIRFVAGRKITEKDIKQYLDDESIIFYISGPRPMVESYQHMIEDLEVHPERIKTDYFPGYQLG